MNLADIENILHAAPRPVPPAGLKERLIAHVRLVEVRPGALTLGSGLAPTSWLRRWWPVLVPATVSLACAVGLIMQQVEIRRLKQVIQGLSRDAAPKAGVLPTPTVQTNDAGPHADAASRTQQEVVRLKELASQLAAEVAQLEQMRAENTKLRTQLAAPPAGLLTPEETEALAKAREKAEAIECINNLKQVGLAARIWAIDRGDMSPPDIVSMADEMGTPKILYCPSDRAREAAKDWASYTAANCSYEYLAPSAPDTEPERVAFRCPTHGHVGLCDGSVQGYIAKQHPEQLVQRDGKLYFGKPPRSPKKAPAPKAGNPGNANP
jgi:hypothetical protein